MISHHDMVKFQANQHGLVPTTDFSTKEEYCLYLIHLRAYEEIANIAESSNVLDVGCNNGYGTAIIAEKSKLTTGVDVSIDSIKAAINQNNSRNVTFMSVDGINLPFADNFFDVIASCQVIEHVVDYGLYLGEILRVMAENGRAVFTTPNARIRLTPGMKPINPFHVREFSATELHDLLSKYFSQVTIQGMFGTQEVYETEINRCRRARLEARQQRSRMFQRYLRLRTRLKSHLPAAAVESARRVRRATVGPTHEENVVLESSFRERYSTRDLFYSDNDLDKSLDLLAICRK